MKRKLDAVETVSEAVNKVYAMGKAVERKMGIKKKVNKDTNGKKKGRNCRT